MEGKMEHCLMEDKRLDLDAPLLSVRRHTTAASISNLAVSPSPAGPIIAPRSVERTPPLRSALPFYKSELKSGPVRNPGVVPFVWEQKPGQPKCEAISRLRPTPAPSLPPGRILNDRGPERFSCESSISVADLATKVCEEKSGENPTTTAALMVTVEDDDNFSDAVETLSRAESFFMNCSVSGLSGIQDAVEPTDCFSADSQVRDFMMGRFLPAAQAMASGLPQYSSRKPPKVAERAANGEQRLRRVPLPYQQTPKFVAPPYPRDPRNEICSADDESYESDYDRNFSSNACGLLPRLCLLNPMPGREVGDRRHRPPLTSWNISKIRSNKTPLVEAENEVKSLDFRLSILICFKFHFWSNW
ncbi:hypothetical protein AXF42_Ash006785 [Apostasia shenzhenica]|uniref:Uncharacterized protein n=1 Tax=Apostasia shenzhenica TaxID=1088818 RepID=A0A2I0AJ46_9ASPA|nr:hypothetical protein AXF42_Ash006785 [Apostasia shenzhenica]